MVRENVKPNAGKFFLAVSTRYGPSYYRASGVYDAGTPRETPFLHWTRYRDQAHGFPTVKAAKRMADRLWSEHGAKVEIVDREGKVRA